MCTNKLKEAKSFLLKDCVNFLKLRGEKNDIKKFRKFAYSQYKLDGQTYEVQLDFTKFIPTPEGKEVILSKQGEKELRKMVKRKER